MKLFSNSPMLFSDLGSKKRLKTFYLRSRGDLINAGNVVPDSFLIWILCARLLASGPSLLHSVHLEWDGGRPDKLLLNGKIDGVRKRLLHDLHKLTASFHSLLCSMHSFFLIPEKDDLRKGKNKQEMRKRVEEINNMNCISFMLSLSLPSASN